MGNNFQQVLTGVTFSVAGYQVPIGQYVGSVPPLWYTLCSGVHKVNKKPFAQANFANFVLQWG